MQKSKRTKIISILITGLIVIGLLVFMFSGDNFEILKSLFRDDLTKEEFKESVRSFGIKGSITLSLLSMLQVVLTFLPAEPVQVLSGIGYGLWHGALVCLAGVILGNIIIYLMYKLYGKSLSDYFHKNIELDFDKISRSKRVALIIFLLYFLPAIPYGLICFFTASLDIKFPRYIMLTTLGSIPSILIGVGLGHMAMSTSWIISLVVFAVLVVLIVIFIVKRKAIFAKINQLIHKHGESYKSDTKVRKPNKFIYALCVLGVKLYVKAKIKFKHKENARVSGPAIVLCSHGSFVDFLYAGLMLKKVYPHFTVARMYFYNRKLGWLLRSLGAFPKSMFSTDIENIQNCLSVIKNGGVLAMMPEARLSTAGEFEDIQPSTIKFIKKMGVPVYGIRINGSYFSKPKWCDKMRRKPLIEAELNLIASANEINEIDQDTLYKKIKDNIGYNDFEWIKDRQNVSYKSKTLAEGLENILCKCPDCGNWHTINSKGTQVFCDECGFTTTVNDRYAFVDNPYFNNFNEWYAWQKGEIEKQVLADKNYQLKDFVQLKHHSYDGKKILRNAGQGECTLSINGLTYEGMQDGQYVVKTFPMASLYRLLFGAGEDFEVYDGKQIYYFEPKDRSTCVKWYIASEILKDLSQKNT